VLVAVVALYARHGAIFTRESAAGRIGTGMLLGMLGLAFVWLAQLPFGIVELWWERRHDISRVGYLDAVVGSFVGLGGVFLFASLAILVAMALAAPLRTLWWAAAAPIFVAIGLLISFVSPYLIPDLDPARPSIEADARRFERAQGLPRIPVKVQRVKKQTTAPNAEAAGIGPTRRVILWDTLLDGRFTRREVRTVLAHELGHHSRDHILKGTGWYALFALPGAWIVAMATRRRGGMYRPEAVPLALFVVVVLQIAAAPLQNVVIRRLEAEADWVSLETTRDPAATRSTFRRLALVSRAEPDPPAWAYVLMENHPTIMQRIEMAEAWRARAGRQGGLRLGDASRGTR
jgi:STE24 endopeptidase